jgi:hypothetical protein
MLLQLFFRVERKGTPPNSFYEANFMLTPNHIRAQHKKKIIDQFFDEHRCKFLNKNFANKIQQHIKRIIHYVQIGFSPKMQGCDIYKSTNIIKHINRIMDKNDMTISIYR